MPRGRTEPIRVYELISVILPVMNNLEYTKRCISSILNMTNVNKHPFELIVIDNASTDGTVEYFEELISNNKNIEINFVSNEKNVGVAPSWNQGVKLAKYDVVCIINNDIEILTENWLEEMEAVLLKSNNVCWVSPRTCYSRNMKKISYKITHYEQLIYGKSTGMYVVGCCFMCPKRIFGEDDLGPFDEGFEIKYYEDLDFIARILSKNRRVRMCPSTIVYHAVGVTSRRTPGGGENENRYIDRWENTPYDILKRQPYRNVKAVKHFGGKA